MLVLNPKKVNKKGLEIVFVCPKTYYSSQKEKLQIWGVAPLQTIFSLEEKPHIWRFLDNFFLSLPMDQICKEVYDRIPNNCHRECVKAIFIPDNCRRRGRRRQCKFFWPV